MKGIMRNPSDILLTPQEKLDAGIGIADNIVQAALGQKRIDKAVYSSIDIATDTALKAADRAVDIVFAPLEWASSWWK